MISVIVPTRHLDTRILACLHALYTHSADRGSLQVLICGSGEVDQSIYKYLDQYIQCIYIHSVAAGRAVQMNYAATYAQGDILYFLHADTLVPLHRDTYIYDAVYRGYDAGSFGLRFDYDHWFLHLWCVMIGYSGRIARFGDQSLFVTHRVWDHLQGYNTAYTIEEDNDFARRVYASYKRAILPAYVITSSDKYLTYGIYRVQCIYIYIHILYLCGVSPRRLTQIYDGFFT